MTPEGKQLRDYLEALLSAVAAEPGDSFISRLVHGSPGRPGDGVELVFAG
ncbi:hypothetical protein ACFVYA_30110 [Amycolatopsis sp. NPDC058278]